MSKTKVDSKTLMRVLNKKNNNFKQLLVKLINNMIKKSYNEFKKKNIKGGDFNWLSMVDKNIKSSNNGDTYKFDNSEGYMYNEDLYKFDNIIRAPSKEISSLELHNTNKYYTPHIAEDIYKPYNISKPYTPVR